MVAYCRRCNALHRHGAEGDRERSDPLPRQGPWAKPITNRFLSALLFIIDDDISICRVGAGLKATNCYYRRGNNLVPRRDVYILL